MGKLADLFYKLTRGESKPKPWEHGPKALADKCGCGKECGCDSVESLERSAGITKKVSVQIVKATVDGTPVSIPREVVDHMVDEGTLTPAKPARKPRTPKLEQVKADAEAMQAKGIVQDGHQVKPVKKKPVAKTTAKKEAIAKDVADEPVKPVAKKTPAKKTTPKKAEGK